MAGARIRGITIEIGGNTSELVKALKSADSAIKNTQSNLRDINKALKIDPSNTNLLKDKQRELAAAIGETKDKLDAEKQALEEMKNTQGFDANSEAARNLQTQIDLDTAALKELEAQARQSSSVLGTQMQLAGAKIEEVGRKIQGVGDKLSSIGRTMTTYVTAPIVGGFAAAVKTTGDFDASMSKVQAVSGAAGEELQALRDKAKEMGETTKFSASESAEALNYMAMAGWKTDQMLSGIEGVMNLAAASGEDLATTSDIVTDALTAFGMTADQSGRFADILASAASNANTNVAMMGESFKYVAPVAGALGYSAEDVAVALGLMANSGIKADMAGTSLRNMFQRMAKPTKESAEAMERLGLELYDDTGKMYSFRDIMNQLRGSMSEINVPLEEYNAKLDELDTALADGTIKQKEYDKELEELNLQAFGAEGAEKARAAAMLGGARAMAGLLAISNATEEDYNKLTNAIDNSSQSFAKLADGSVVPLNEALASGQEVIEQYSGSAEAMANTMLDNFAGQTTILKSQIEGLAISFGELLMPTVREVVGEIQKFVDKLNSLDDAQKEQIIKIALIVAAIGPALLIIGKIVSGIGGLVMGIGKLVTFAGKITTLISSFGGLGGAISAALGAIASPIGIIVAAVAALAAGFVYLYTTSEEFRNTINTALAGVKEQFAATVEALKPIWEMLKQIIAVLMEELRPIFTVIAQAVIGFVSGVLAALAPIIEFVVKLIETIVNLVKAFFALLNGDFDGFKSGIMSALSSFVEAIKAFFTGVVQFWLAFFRTFGVDLQQVFTTLWNVIKTVISTALNSIKTTVTNIWTSIKTWLSNTLTSIHDKFKEMFDNMKKAVSERVDKIKTTIVEGMQKAVDFIKALPAKFLNWGKDMIQNLIDGIKSKISAVRDAIGDIAETIASYIHFSVPDKGALANADTYMPDFMDLLTRGIKAGMPEIERAMQGLTLSMRPELAAGAGGATGNNTVNITVYGAQGQDVNELAQIIEQRISENVVRRGVAFA